MPDLDFAFDEQLACASTLPSRFYLDPGVLEEETSRIFAHTWQYAGAAAALAEPGSFLTGTVADEPVLLARGADGTLRALSNVCRHRAGPVARGAGRCRSFRCGYHGWTYAADGRLLGTPEWDGVEDFRREEHGLPAFRARTWSSMAFVNLDPAAPDLVESLADLPARLAGGARDGLRLAASKDWTVEANWKVYVDNYLEGYHIPFVHPGLFRELDYTAYRVETRGLYSAQHAPIVPADGGRIRRTGAAAAEAQFFWIFPNLMLNVYPDSFQVNLVVPLGAGRTRTLFEWYVREPERADVRQALEHDIALSDEIQREDVAICEAVQRGLRSRTYERGRYSVRRENGVHHFHGLWARFMTAKESPWAASRT